MIYLLVEVVTHHQHVEVFVDGVLGVGSSGVGGGGQHVGFTAHSDDVGGVTTSRALRVVCVDRATAEGFDGLFHTSRLIQRVRVNHHLGQRSIVRLLTLQHTDECKEMFITGAILFLTHYTIL